MATLDTEIEFEVQCECGRDLTVKSTDGLRYGFAGKVVVVEKCDDCTDEARGDGYATGLAESEDEED